MPGHKGPVTGAVFAADSKVLYSLGEDGTVRQWDPAGSRQRQSSLLPAEADQVALAPDGRAVVFRTDAKAFAVWDLAAGAARARGARGAPRGGGTGTGVPPVTRRAVCACPRTVSSWLGSPRTAPSAFGRSLPAAAAGRSTTPPAPGWSPPSGKPSRTLSL